jgi:hypothetical protein
MMIHRTYILRELSNGANGIFLSLLFFAFVPTLTFIEMISRFSGPLSDENIFQFHQCFSFFSWFSFYTHVSLFSHTFYLYIF